MFKVLDIFGAHDEPSKIEMTWDTLQKCDKIGRCVNETMRLYPTLPSIGRAANKDTSLPTGGGENGTQPVAVAKGTVVMCSLYLMHRRNQEWGEDTGKWIPERCKAPTFYHHTQRRLTFAKGIGRTPGHEFAPFGGGPRICPGRKYHPQSLSIDLS